MLDKIVAISEFLLNLKDIDKLKEIIEQFDDDMKNRLVDSLQKLYNSNSLEVPIENILNVVFESNRAKSEIERLQALKTVDLPKKIAALEELKLKNKNNATQVKILRDLLHLYSLDVNIDKLQETYDELEKIMISEDNN